MGLSERQFLDSVKSDKSITLLNVRFFPNQAKMLARINELTRDVTIAFKGIINLSIELEDSQDTLKAVLADKANLEISNINIII
jgi:hypothetical protein